MTRDDQRPSELDPEAETVDSDTPLPTSLAVVTPALGKGYRSPLPGPPGERIALGTEAAAPTLKAADVLAAGEDTASRSRPDTSVSPVQAARHDEIARTRAFLHLVFAFFVVMPPCLIVLDGDPLVARVLLGAIVVCIPPSIWLYVILRDPERYREWTVVSVMMVITLTTYVGIYYWGIFSPAPALVVVGIFFFCRAQSARAAWVVYLACAGIQAVLVALVLSGALRDRGIFQAGDRRLIELVIAQGQLQVVFLFTFWLARSARHSMLTALTRHQNTVRQVAQREALLLEARQDLDRALQVGSAGRYTEQTLGAFRLGPIIGRGAMGEVYEASHTGTGQPAAVKVLHPNVLDNPGLVARFLREARAASALSSPHVVRVLAASPPGEPMPYLVMERLRGRDLASQLRDVRRLSLKQLGKLVEEVGEALDEARKKDIVHRDLKPQNLFLAERDHGEPVWKVLDFGVSKLGEHGGTLTHGGIVGTPVYMAPEQARSAAVDYRADLYALAAIVYRCVTGRPPFSGRDPMAVLYSVVHEPAPRPSVIAGLPVAFDAVLAVGMAKEPDDRFDSAAQLGAALAAAGEGRLNAELGLRAEALLQPSRKKTSSGVISLTRSGAHRRGS